MRKATAIILAAGKGDRMGSAIPKQFLSLGTRPIFMHTLLKFDKIEYIKDIVLVLPSSAMAEAGPLIEGSDLSKNVELVKGGSSRQRSSYAGVKASPVDSSIVLVHDSVRPFAGEELIRGVIEMAFEHKAAVCAIRCGDTVAETEGGFIRNIPHRENMVRIQTPQAFERALIIKAHERAIEKGLDHFTDDCGMVLDMGYGVKVSEGSESNIKITRPRDLLVAETLLRGEKGGGQCSERY